MYAVCCAADNVIIVMLVHLLARFANYQMVYCDVILDVCGANLSVKFTVY